MTDQRTPLIDVHAHFLTDEYVAAAVAAGHSNPDGMPRWPTWNAEQHLRLMDEWGVRKAILSISSPGTHFGDDEAARALTRQVNEVGAATARQFPDRFGHFASLPMPDVNASLAEVEHALDDLGSDGIALSTNVHGSYLGDRHWDPVWAELDRRNAVVFVHPTSPPNFADVSLQRPRPMLEFIFDSTRTVSDLVFANVFSRYPDIQWIFTHGGGTLPLLADRMELFRTVFLDASPDEAPVPDQLHKLWFDMAGSPFPNQIPALVAAFGRERLLYGSDYCWTPPSGTSAQIAAIDSAAPPPQDSWRALTTRNANRLLPGTSKFRSDRIGDRLT